MAETTQTYAYTPPERSVFSPANESPKIVNQTTQELPKIGKVIQIEQVKDKK